MFFFFFFFFKQKTAYEIMPSLVGSEMCIRDRLAVAQESQVRNHALVSAENDRFPFCLLYTSDAADDLLCVDLAGRRTIKKKRGRSSPPRPPPSCERVPTSLRRPPGI